MFYEQNLQPMEVELEATRLRLFKYLQGEFRRGGSVARVPASDQQCALLATEFPALQGHWRRVFGASCNLTIATNCIKK